MSSYTRVYFARKNKEEAIENIKEAIEGCILVRKEMGLPLMEEIAELEVAL